MKISVCFFLGEFRANFDIKRFFELRSPPAPIMGKKLPNKPVFFLRPFLMCSQSIWRTHRQDRAGKQENEAATQQLHKYVSIEEEIDGGGGVSVKTK